jgi:hypothetical protein
MRRWRLKPLTPPLKEREFAARLLVFEVKTATVSADPEQQHCCNPS